MKPLQAFHYLPFRNSRNNSVVDEFETANTSALFPKDHCENKIREFSIKCRCHFSLLIFMKKKRNKQTASYNNVITKLGDERSETEKLIFQDKYSV